MLEDLDLNQEYDREFGKRLREHLDFVYPYEADVTLHTKMSVSELKKMGQFTDDEEAELPFGEVLLWPEEEEEEKEQAETLLTEPEPGKKKRRKKRSCEGNRISPCSGAACL